MKRFLTAAALGSAGILMAHNAAASGLRPIVAGEVDSSVGANALFYLGLNSNLYELANSGSGWSWAKATGPAVAAGTGAEPHVNTIYGPNEVHYLTQTATGVHVEQLYGKNYSPQDLTVIGVGKAAAGASSLVGFIDSLAGTDNVFYIGADQGVHVLTWAPMPGWKEDITLDGTAATSVAAGSPFSGHLTAKSQEVFYLGSNRHVYELWRWSQNFDGWHPQDVTSVTTGTKAPVAARSRLAGFYDPASGNDAVFYQGTNQHIYELLFPNTATWTAVDLTAGSSAPNALGGTALSANLNTISGSEEVFFLDANHNVNILWSWSSPQKFDGWHTYNVSLSAGVPPVAANGSALSSYVSSIDNADHVYYVAADKHIHELLFNETTGGWLPVDVSAQTTPVAPKAVP